MSEPQWLNGRPSYSLSLSPAECLEELRDAVKLAAEYVESSKRVSMALALAWAEWKLTTNQEEA